jgi:putative nucleotidyltransferase with HDIG domain/PAS domain S-box-containing protein
MNIKGKLLFWYLIPTILTGILIAVTGYYFNHRTIKQDIFAHLITVNNKLNDSVRDFIDMKKRLIFAFSSDSLVKECMEDISKGNNRAYYYTGRLNTHLVRNMQSINPAILEILIADLDGNVISSTEINQIGQNVSGEIYFSRTVKMGCCISDLHYSPEFNQNTFEVTRLITGEETHKPTGIIVSKYSGASLKKVTSSGMSEEFQELMQQNGLGKTGETYIVNGNKLMITESRFIKDAVLKQVVDTEGVRVALDNRMGMFGTYPDYRGVPVMGVSRYFEEMGWVLLAEKEVSEAFVPIKRLRYFTVIIGIGGIMVIVAISVFLSRGITRPARELVESANAIAEGDLSKEIKVRSKDEIGRLAGSLETMRTGLGGLLKNIEEAKQDWENTFDSISDLISIHDENFHIIRCNKALARKFNTQPEDLIGRKCHEVFHGINDPWPACPLVRCKETRKPETVEAEDPHMGGVFLISAFPRFDEQGRFIGGVQITRDVTERRHYEGRITEESEINKILLEMAGAMLKTENVSELIEKSIAIISENLGCDYCSIILWAEDTNSFNAVEAIGKEEAIVDALSVLRIKKPYIPLIERIIESKRDVVVYVDDEDEKTREFMEGIQAESMIIAPLVSRVEVTGFVLYYYSPNNKAGSGDLHRFSRKEEAVIEGMAGQLSLGLANTRLYEELMGKSVSLESRVETMSVMREIDRTILSSLEPVHTYEVATQLVKRVIPCDRVTIVLIDKEAGGFRYTAGWGVELEKGAFVRFEDTNATEAVRTKRPVIRLNIAGEENLLPLDKSFLEKGFLSDIRIPLIIKDDVYGLLNIGSRRRAGFTSEQIKIAKDIASQISVALSNANLVTELKDLYFNTVKSLSEAIDAKSKWTRGHSDRVTDMAVSIGEGLKLGQADMENLRLAATLHDIGKIGTCEDILDKPEALSKDEQKMMQAHPVRGAEIIGGIKQFKNVTPAVRHHHERFDGCGYPDGLKGGEIPLFARIIFVADSFDAMTSERPYRKGLSREKGIEEVRKGSGTQFDPEIVEAFLKINEA